MKVGFVTSKRELLLGLSIQKYRLYDTVLSQAVGRGPPSVHDSFTTVCQASQLPDCCFMFNTEKHTLFITIGKMWHLDYADGGYEEHYHLGCDAV